MKIKEILCKSLWLQLTLVSVMGMFVYNASVYAEDAEEWMPDPNLRQTVREILELPVDEPLTKEKMLQLTKLHAIEKGIVNIQGLEFAVNLTALDLAGNSIKDISPLQGLMNLAYLGLGSTNLSDLSPLASLTSLIDMDLGDNQISDLSPLSELTALTKLDLQYNQISDLSPLVNLISLRDINLRDNPLSYLSPLSNLINLEALEIAQCKVSDVSPLAGLENLRELRLNHNYIEDFSPLVGLPKLRKLWIHKNSAIDLSMLAHLNLETFVYDEFCIFHPLAPPVEKRIKGRSLPSAVQAWDHLVGTTDDNTISSIVLHDLYFSASHSLDFGVGWHLPDAEQTYGLSTVLSRWQIDEAKEAHQRVMDMNPNIILLFEIRIHNHLSLEAFPSDSEHWLKNAGGNVLERPKNVPWDEYYIDLFNPNTQALLIDRIVAVANCGLFDGLFLDGFFMQGSGSNRWDEVERYADTKTKADMIEAHATILEGVRERVREDFLILVNANRTKIPRYVEYVNGIFMETGHDSNGSYTREGIMKMRVFPKMMIRPWPL